MINNGKGMMNLKPIVIVLFTIYMLTASIYVPVFNSVVIQMIILMGILYILIIDIISEKINFSIKDLFIKKIDIYFIFAICAAIGSLHGSKLTTVRIAGPVIFSLCFLISFFIRSDINNYYYSIKLIEYGGLFYAISVIFSFLFPDMYYKCFLILLRPGFIENVLSAMQKGYFSGFTSNSAFAAGYIVNSLGILCCNWVIYEKVKNKKEIIMFIVLLFGLLLTQKRALLLFFFISWLFVYIQYSRSGYEKVKKIFKLMLLSLIMIFLLIFIVKRTYFGKLLFSRIIETYHIFVTGGDITSNRIPLYKHALRLFIQNPIHGIGWGNYKKTVVGTVTMYTEMQVHNIYLQLLCETGIIGSFFILLPMIMTYFYSIRTMCKISKKRNEYSYKWIFAVIYSVYVQTFFLLYGLTGNPLYDYSFLTMYFLAYGLICSFDQQRHKIDKNLEGLI